MTKPSNTRLTLALLAAFLAGPPMARGATQADAQAECQGIAQQQSGYNPNAASSSQPQAGGRARGAAAGAMAGAAKGKSKSNQYGNVPDQAAEEYTRNQAQEGAKMGAAAGASKQRQQRRQSAMGQQESSAAYQQAYSACMAGKGFPGQ